MLTSLPQAAGRFYAYDLSSQSVLRAEISRTTFKEKELVTYEWTDEDTFVFHQFQMPEGIMGIRIQSDTGDSRLLERMEQAYREWVESDTENQ